MADAVQTEAKMKLSLEPRVEQFLTWLSLLARQQHQNVLCSSKKEPQWNFSDSVASFDRSTTFELL